MPDTVVPYARFLEIRQRRRRVVAELTQQVVAAPNGDSLDRQPVTIDSEALRVEHCGTRSPLAADDR